MAVIRVHKNKNYTVMSNYHFREKEMTLKAKGLLSLILSLPEDWDYSISGLVAICVEKESAIVTALKELKKFGYLYIEKRLPNETESGRIEYTYHIYEKPQNIQNKEKQAAEKQGVENQGLVFQGLENQGQLSTDNKVPNNKILNNKNTKDNKKESKNKNNSFDSLIENYVETVESSKADVVRGLLQDWLKNRKAKRAPMTDRSIELNLKVLNECAAESNMTIDEYLEAVIRRGWQAFFPINNVHNTPHPAYPNNTGNPFLDLAKDEGIF